MTKKKIRAITPIGMYFRMSACSTPDSSKKVCQLGLQCMRHLHPIASMGASLSGHQRNICSAAASQHGAQAML